MGARPRTARAGPPEKLVGVGFYRFHHFMVSQRDAVLGMSEPTAAADAFPDEPPWQFTVSSIICSLLPVEGVVARCPPSCGQHPVHDTIFLRFPLVTSSWPGVGLHAAHAQRPAPGSIDFNWCCCRWFVDPETQAAPRLAPLGVRRYVLPSAVPARSSSLSSTGPITYRRATVSYVRTGLGIFSATPQGTSGRGMLQGRPSLRRRRDALVTPVTADLNP